MSQVGEPPAPSPGRRGQGRPSRLRSVNLGVRLVCELALLVALAVAGFPLVAVGFAAVVAVNMTLDRVLA